MDETEGKQISKCDVEAEHYIETVDNNSVSPQAKVNDPCTNFAELEPTIDVLSMNVDDSEIDARNNNIMHSDDMCEKTQSSKQVDIEDDHIDGFKKLDWESVLRDRAMAECAENQDELHKVALGVSPCPEERHQRTIISSMAGQSRPHRNRSRSRSRSRSFESRSPSHASNQGSERWSDNGRMRAGIASTCRNFGAGRCTRGSECPYLHESGGSRQIDRRHDAEVNDGRGSRVERERHPGFETRENLTDLRDKNNYSQEKLSRRREERLEDASFNNESHRGYRSNSRCFDFSIGRCYRGANCRYVHDHEQFDGGRTVRDDYWGRTQNRRDERSSFSRTVDHARTRDIPCRFFSKGRCQHGEKCRFSHQIGSPTNISVEMPHESYQQSGKITSADSSELRDQSTQIDVDNRTFMSGESEKESKVGVAEHKNKENVINRSSRDSNPAQTCSTYKESRRQEQHSTTQKGCEMISTNNNPLPTIPITGKIADHRGRSQFAPQHSHSPSFPQNSSFQQFVPPLAFNGQMRPPILHHPQNGQNHFSSISQLPDALSFNSSMQNQPVNSSCINPHNLDSRGQLQQNILMMPHILPQNIPSRVPAAPSVHTSNGQNHIAGSQPSSSPQILNSDDNNCQLSMKNDLNSPRQPIPSNQAADSSDLKPSPLNSDNSIAHKVVTSEQAAKITGLSASLAQFFGNAALNSQSAALNSQSAALNSQSAAVMTPPAFLNPGSVGSFVAAGSQLPLPFEGSQANLSCSNLSDINASVEKSNQQIHSVENVQPVDDSSARDVEKIRDQNDDAGDKKDGDDKKVKESKEIRMFKCALIEFVKDILKPKWKEGQLSKEAHKTIVKKVVEKVAGSLQGPNVPQTQEKIDLYLLNSKAKLSKFVQAYVEKYVKS